MMKHLKYLMYGMAVVASIVAVLTAALSIPAFHVVIPVLIVSYLAGMLIVEELGL